MKAVWGIIGILGLFSGLTLLLPLLERQLVLFPDKWTYTPEHFIIAGSLSGLGAICPIILFAIKGKETQK